MEDNAKDNSLLADTIGNAIKIPGIKVNRDAFLIEVFDKETAEMRNDILEKGPVEAGIGQVELKRIAKKLVNERTLTSTGISFAAGLPGGLLW